MSNLPNQSKNETSRTRRTPGVRGLHRLPLKDAKEIARAVFEIGGLDPVPRTLALDHLGRVPKSGSSDQLVGASNYYGLTIKSGSNDLKLTERGSNLVDPSSSKETRQKAALDAVFSNEMFSALVAKYAAKAFPMDKTIHLYLTQNGLSQVDASLFWGVTKENLEDTGLIQELSSGGKMIISRETLERKSKTTDEEIPDVDDQTEQVLSASELIVPQATNIEKPAISNTSSEEVIAPQFNFNIEIQLPENATEEVYEAIFKNIAKYLLRRNQE